MSIETQLSAITGLLEEVLRIMKQGQPLAATESVPIPNAPLQAGGPAPQPPAAGAPPAPVPPGPPAAAAPPAPGPAPAPVASAPTAPGAPGPAPAPAAGPTLDQIRDKLNNWWRAHPDRSGEIMVILGEVGVQKVDDIPPAQYGVVWQKLEALGG